jgi:methylglutaconyl-CoA hydratase
MMYTFITVGRSDAITTVTLARPKLHNALNATMIAELRDCFTALAHDPTTRVVVLTGAGASFCSGGDLTWMQSSLDWSREQNTADAEALADMFEAAWDLSKPLVGRINGAAIGGGVGLVACCDIALAADTAHFGFSEVKLGLLPAIIAQYAVPKIGISQARALFVSGARFTAERAFEIGLVHGVVGAEELDATVASLCRQLLSNGPEATSAAKRLVDAIWTLDRDTARRYVIEAITAARTSAEGQEGMRAFLEKRKPSWSG